MSRKRPARYDVYEFDKADPHRHMQDLLNSLCDSIDAGRGDEVLRDLDKSGMGFAADFMRGMADMRKDGHLATIEEVIHAVDAGDLAGALAIIDKAVETGKIPPEHTVMMRKTAYERADEPEMELETLKGDKSAPSPAHYSLRAELLYRLGRYGELAEWCDEWNPSNDGDGRLDFLVSMAQLAYVRGDAAKAKKQAVAVLDRYEFGPEAYELIGDILADKGDMRGAVMKYNNALEQDYNIIYLHVKKAQALVKMDRPDAAALACRRGLEIRPQNKALKKILAEL